MQTVYLYRSCSSFFLKWDRLCDFKMHSCIALNIFALHLERPCTSKSTRNATHTKYVCVPACLPVIGLSYLYISTFNSWFIFVVCFLTYFALFVCCFSRLFVSFRFFFFRLYFLSLYWNCFFAGFVTKSCCCPAALQSEISRWCYKMGIVMCAVSNFDAFLTYVSSSSTSPHSTPLCFTLHISLY